MLLIEFFAVSWRVFSTLLTDVNAAWPPDTDLS